ncbi:hypothetical protein ACHAW5_000405 [Stephanodiscus triporus]|uniref:Major facilitator superfamily (MFS) profile domain-containing protein n=1 Tax=Stephanodiscus triporus TaxID=2934178 RepID=A0ABD3QVZ8_9STRA
MAMALWLGSQTVTAYHKAQSTRIHVMTPMASQNHPDEIDKPERGRCKFVTHLSMDDGSVRDRDRLLGIFDGDIDGDHNLSHSAFLSHFFGSPGPPQITALCLSIALALGSTVGIVPAIVEDRYARLRHGYSGEPCLDLAKDYRPYECSLGNDDAQNSAALASFVSNSLTFVTSSLMGSISDERGRRGIMLIGIGLCLLAPLNLVLMQLFETMDPFLYYASHAISGLVSWFAIALSALSDVMPPMWRAPSFGLVAAGFSLGFALSPILAVYLSHLGVSLFALGILFSGFIFACGSLPETLSPEASENAKLKKLAELPAMDTQMDVWKYNLLRPENFGFNDKDIAILFLIMGTMGILVQAVVLKPLSSWMGERRVIMVAFMFGALHNLLYGIAKAKRTLFISATIASLTGMSFPTISAIKANNVEYSEFIGCGAMNKTEMEQGRVQGALYSLSSLASAIGPIMLRYVYYQTKDGGGFGKGTMFIFGSFLYLVATVCAWLLPEEQTNSNLRRNVKTLSSDCYSDYGAADEEK